MDGFNISTVKISKIDIADAKIRANGPDVAANASAIAVVDTRARNNSTSVKDTLAIRDTSDCLEEIKETAV